MSWWRAFLNYELVTGSFPAIVAIAMFVAFVADRRRRGRPIKADPRDALVAFMVITLLTGMFQAIGGQAAHTDMEITVIHAGLFVDGVLILFALVGIVALTIRRRQQSTE